VRRVADRLRHRGRDLLVDARLVVLRRTSVGDAGSFPAACARAAADPEAFATFKTDPAVRVVVENLACEHGRRYLDLALAERPSLGSLLDRFRENDRLGRPRTCDYGEHGRFAPTTLRYVKVVADLLTLFGPLDGARIVEIGGGYGGQCFVTSVATSFASYTLVDLEPVLALQRVYLRELGVRDVDLRRADELDPAAEHDLVVSNFAFSECVRRVQRLYVERVFRRSSRGYVACNWPRPRLSFTRDELLAAVPGSRFTKDDPTTGTGADILVWGDRR
jgi:hypothetical protein